MSKNFRILLIVIGLATLVVTAIFMIPRGLGLYFQLKGGQQLDQVIRQSTGPLQMDLMCDPLPAKEVKANDRLAIAVQNLNQAILLNPQNSQAYLQLGRANCLLGEPEKARINFQKFTELRPNNPLGYLGLGFAYESLGNHSAGKSAWKKAGLTADDFRVEGDHAFETSEYQIATDWYLRSLMMDPSFVSSWVGLGKSYELLNDLDAALHAFQEAWEINPKQSTAGYAAYLTKRGDFTVAEQILLSALDGFPESPERIDWWKALGIVYQNQRKLDDAVVVYRNSLKEFPENIDFHIALGWIYYEKQRDIPLPKSEFEKAIEINPGSGKGYFALAQLFNREGRFEDAEPYYQKAVELSPGNRWYSLDRARNARQAGDYQVSLRYYKELIRRFPDFPQAYYQVSLAYQLVGQENEAINAIKKAITLMNPPNDDIYARAGEIYRQAGFKEKAIDAYQDALEVNPENETAKEGLEILDK